MGNADGHIKDLESRMFEVSEIQFKLLRSPDFDLVFPAACQFDSAPHPHDGSAARVHDDDLSGPRGHYISDEGSSSQMSVSARSLLGQAPLHAY
jgi:hypothetical protein